MSATVLIFAHMLKIAEAPYFRQEDDLSLLGVMDSYFNGIWLTLITLTTVGYGDIPPCTTFGRLILMTVAIWGSFIMSLLVVVIQSVFELPVEEKMALRHINLTRHAAKAITLAMKYFRAKRKANMLRYQRNPMYEQKSRFLKALKA